MSGSPKRPRMDLMPSQAGYISTSKQVEEFLPLNLPDAFNRVLEENKSAQKSNPRAVDTAAHILNSVNRRT